MATFTNRKRFTTREVGAIRKKYHELEENGISGLTFEMNVDGHNIGKVDYGHETFFRFSTPSYAIEMWPMYVRHKKNEPAIGLCIRSYDHATPNILDCNIATAQRKPEEILDDAYFIVGELELLRVHQGLS